MTMPAYRVLANAFVDEGVKTLFVLTGDGNMHWEAAFTETCQSAFKIDPA